MMNTINLVVADSSKFGDDTSRSGILRSSSRRPHAEIRLTWSAAPTGRLHASWTAER